MATPWPPEVAWPAEHREHATKLTKYLRDALACIDSSPNQSVPTNHIKFVLHGMVSLLAKIRNVPDLSSIHDSLRIMQEEARSANKETTQALARVKEDVHSNTTEASRSTAAGEEVKVLAKEAVEVGKIAVGIIREVKNRGPQPNGGAQMSYAAVAASGTLASSIHNPQNAKNIPTQTQREVTVNIRDPLTIQSLRAMNSRVLNAHVERAIQRSGNESLTGIKVMSSNQLKSGDLSIRATGSTEAQALRAHTSDWVHRIGAGASVRNPTYGVLAHGIRTSTMDMDKFEDVRDNILQDNRPFIPKAEIKHIGWLTRTAPSKSASSVVIEFTKAEDANKIIDEGLVWQGELFQCERYEKQCRLKQCFNCQRYGHIGTQCKTTKACGYCAQEHSSRDCPAKDERSGARKCAVCHGEHEAWSQQCPARKEELAKAKLAYTNRPRYHPVPPTAAASVQFGRTAVGLRRKRSARDFGNQPETDTPGTTGQTVRGHKRTNTGVVPGAGTEKENEAPEGLSSQRPQRTIHPSRRALEARSSNILRRTSSSQYMDIDDDTDA